MDFVRMSVLPQSKDDLGPNEVKFASLAKFLDAPHEVYAEAVHAARRNQCSEILPLLVDSTFMSKYWTLPIGIPDCYVYSHRSTRCIVLEVVTKFPNEQIENLYSYKFATHPLFEAKLSTFARYKGNENPNPNIVRSRPWDIALNVVMKVEAIPNPFDRFCYLLKREYKVMEHLWTKYLDTNMDIDEMTGIPMVFEYAAVPNDTFFAASDGPHVSEIDIYGRMKRLKFELGFTKRPTLSYMTMEKLGPSISYLQQLVRAAQRPPTTFDMWTALKVFDQLLCRILQVHRFSVVHNDICPENIYMGNGVVFDVVYLNNFKRSYVIAEGDKEGPSGLSLSCMGCNLRFASVGQLSGTPRLMTPIDDVESAFYLLLSMFSADSLPWDSLLRLKRSSEYSLPTKDTDGSNAYDDQTMQSGPPQISTDTIKRMQEFKQRFWNSNQTLKLLVSNMACVFSHDDYQATTIISVINEIYYRLKDWRQMFKSSEESFLYCRRIVRPTSDDFRQFMELRKCALIHFKFADTFDIINDITFRKKIANMLKNDSLLQQPWNYIVWCFNNVEVRTDLSKGRYSKDRSMTIPFSAPISMTSMASRRSPGIDDK